MTYGDAAGPAGPGFLRSRLAVPGRPGTFLRRERLVERLDRGLRAPLTLVGGPAGAGKTLLAADWAAGARAPVAWLTAEAGDRDPGAFWAYAVQALRGVDHFPVDASRVDDAFLGALAARLGDRERPVVLVVDEFDRVTAPEVAEQLDFVLRHAGRGLRLVLVSRTEPLLPLHRYRAAGELTEIRAAELALTPAEAGALLELHGLRLSAHAVHALVDRTRGWAAGVRLAALAARESDDPERYLKEFEAGHGVIADFLLAEVLKRQPDRTQDLLLRVSVLDRFRPGLADALTGRADAEALLVGLHRANAFVEDLGHSWYRLHPLFREILRAHLRMRLPGLEPELHRRAARWLHEQGLLPETLAHGAAAGDWDYTARALVDDLAIGTLLTRPGPGGPVGSSSLFAGMGPGARSPAADLVRAARELSRYDAARARAPLRRAREHLPAEVTGPAPGAAAERLTCALLDVLAARLTGSPARAERAARAADALRREVPAELLDAHREFFALLGTHLGSVRLWAGRYEDARAALSAVAGPGGGTAALLPREEALAHLALLDYLDGRLTRAEHKALASMSAGADVRGAGGPAHDRAGTHAGSALGRLVLAAVAVDRDELDRAGDLLGGAAAPPPDGRDPVPAAARALATAQLLLARGRTRAAVEAARPGVPTAVASPWAAGHEALAVSAAHLAAGRPDEAAEALGAVPDDEPACAVRAAALQLAAGRPGAALDLLDGVRAARGRAGPAVTVRAALVWARLAHDAGDTASARTLVARAVADARRERLRRPFVDAGPWLRPLLPAAPGAPGPRPPVVPLVAVELSGREHDVLERLAAMLTTEEIAADLHVSVNTVKTHLKSAYRKLAVNRRSDAVRRARDLGLL
ncbi:LuxR C-terminal-related transcriptional regulator [Streptomyces sp. NPDC015131]|uniref:LuxR C-terminal-related transcriptional regulator n=1 Tax=Streptomyces sp. NPDC015131 TaxID=3364941 RepID=UPI0036F6C610